MTVWIRRYHVRATNKQERKKKKKEKMSTTKMPEIKSLILEFQILIFLKNNRNSKYRSELAKYCKALIFVLIIPFIHTTQLNSLYAYYVDRNEIFSSWIFSFWFGLQKKYSEAMQKVELCFTRIYIFNIMCERTSFSVYVG